MAEVAAVKFVSPWYKAVMAWIPPLRAAVVRVATPELMVTVPRDVPLSLKVTVPVGVAAEPVTVAVKVSDCENTEGFADEVRVTDEAA